MTDVKLTVWAVRWLDAHQNPGEFESHEVIHRPWGYITTGILVKNDETGITLSQDVGEDGRFRGTTFVPKAMIVEVWKIGLLNPRANRRKAVVDQQIPVEKDGA